MVGAPRTRPLLRSLAVIRSSFYKYERSIIKQRHIASSGGVMRIIVALCAGAMLAGCASSAENVSAAYVSPLQYKDYSCQQLAQEAERVSIRAQTLTGGQNSKATKDAVATGVAIIVFWPAAFMVGGNDQTTAELAQMKGSLQTIQQVGIQKDCGLQIEIQEEKPQRGTGIDAESV